MRRSTIVTDAGHLGVAFILGALLLTACTAAGTTAASPGSARHTFLVAGQERSYWLHVPPAPSSLERPLVLAFHGRGGTGQELEWLSGLSQLADAEGFLVAYPDGLDKGWHYGVGADDVAFVAALLRQVEQAQRVDSRRIFATGISDGGFFASYFACRRPGTLAAIAPVSASLTDGLAALCAATPPLPVTTFFGTADPMVPWAGKANGIPLLNLLSAPDAMRFWANHDGCTSAPQQATLPAPVPADGTQVHRATYGGCRSGADVVFYAIQGGGHAWPGGQQYLPIGIIGRTTHAVDASAAIWQFFQRHPRPS